MGIGYDCLFGRRDIGGVWYHVMFVCTLHYTVILHITTHTTITLITTIITLQHVESLLWVLFVWATWYWSRVVVNDCNVAML